MENMSWLVNAHEMQQNIYNLLLDNRLFCIIKIRSRVDIGALMQSRM